MEDRFRLIAEVHLILRDEGRYLLLQRFQTGYMDGLYSVVAGHVDGGETFTHAMVREAKEEAGITLTAEALRLVHVMHKHAERVSLFYETEEWSGQIHNAEPDKCSDLAFYTIAEKRDVMVPYVRQALGCIEKGVIYSEFGWP